MAMTENQAREAIAVTARSLFDRGLTHGSTGNISLRLDDGRWLVTPTGSSFGSLDPACISLLDGEGRVLSGDPPSKEAFLHRAMYRQRANAGAVVHLHSIHSVAASVLADVDPDDVLPPLTAYYVMRVGRLPLLPYHAPGDDRPVVGRQEGVMLLCCSLGEQSQAVVARRVVGQQGQPADAHHVVRGQRWQHV